MPIGEAVQVIQAKLREDDSLAEGTRFPPDRVAELLDMCLQRSTYFSYGGELCEQREGATWTPLWMYNILFPRNPISLTSSVLWYLDVMVSIYGIL